LTHYLSGKNKGFENNLTSFLTTENLSQYQILGLGTGGNNLHSSPPPIYFQGIVFQQTQRHLELELQIPRNALHCKISFYIQSEESNKRFGTHQLVHPLNM